MKKLFYSLLVVLVSFGLLYLFQPFLGFNISISEVLGGSFPFLKPQPPKSIDLKNDFILKPYVQHLDSPRFMYVTESGDLLVTEPPKGNVLLIPYKKPNQKRVLLSGLNNPHSMDVYKNYLYVAEENAIGRVEYDAKEGRTIGRYERIIKNIPDDGGHWTRTIKFGPDGYGYVSIGSSCNVCIEKNPLRASISRFKPGEDHVTVYATGLRNAVGFDWSPTDGGLYATENSRDYLGDNFPPDELNLIQENQFYGWPYANGDRVPDPKFGNGQEQMINRSQIPVLKFAAHQAPLGITFIKNPQSPLYNKALVAFHGSWNSSIKVGYKVVSLTFENGVITQNDFITGFLKNGKVIGRPVHVVEGKEGELYLSDDFNGVIYVIEHK
ncbi:PQQ-dependent sugar dehydrogenase [Legionella resiliens]|uniref:PQQ-dependent sugar dehydrogenase n=1 Tax=Legionella resiliens TaxID=2905958 RepID=A0ABS8X1D7_9GAMM|nr:MULTISPECIES: PQQ-dependent sugar dehydrogenase [unclassified Legionella]MCE0721754.1 PQQ-dependent sugar dehydrogenase [Legionella sp. 9fVS26]MCE3530908.1 PQQ-dependent sugar dehydrogenase [Legionella sp. 8cVS16]